MANRTLGKVTALHVASDTSTGSSSATRPSPSTVESLPRPDARGFRPCYAPVEEWTTESVVAWLHAVGQPTAADTALQDKLSGAALERHLAGLIHSHARACECRARLEVGWWSPGRLYSSLLRSAPTIVKRPGVLHGLRGSSSGTIGSGARSHARRNGSDQQAAGAGRPVIREPFLVVLQAMRDDGVDGHRVWDMQDNDIEAYIPEYLRRWHTKPVVRFLESWKAGVRVCRRGGCWPCHVSLHPIPRARTCVWLRRPAGTREVRRLWPAYRPLRARDRRRRRAASCAGFRSGVRCPVAAAVVDGLRAAPR